MSTFFAKYEGTDFLLSDDKLNIGDRFVFVNPYDSKHILSNRETLKFDKIDFRKVEWVYDKSVKNFISDDIIHTMREVTPL